MASLFETYRASAEAAQLNLYGEAAVFRPKTDDPYEQKRSDAERGAVVVRGIFTKGHGETFGSNSFAGNEVLSGLIAQFYLPASEAAKIGAHIKRGDHFEFTGRKPSTYTVSVPHIADDGSVNLILTE